MICIVIPTLNCADHLSMLLPQLGSDERIVVADGGSTDGTISVAVKKALIAAGAKGRGAQLALGANHSGNADWLLFIHADNQLPAEWRASVQRHISRHPKSVGYFRYRANANGFWPRFMDFWVGMRCQWWGLPYGDQGLLISKKMYEDIGGYPEQILFEDVALIDTIKARFGRAAIRPLSGYMRINLSKYEREGIWKRGRKNLKLLRAYRQGQDLEVLAQKYEGEV